RSLQLLQEGQPIHVRELQVSKYQIGRMGLDVGQRGFRTLRLCTDESERSADGHAQFADALLIVYYQEPDSKIVCHVVISRSLRAPHPGAAARGKAFRYKGRRSASRSSRSPRSRYPL